MRSAFIGVFIELLMSGLAVFGAQAAPAASKQPIAHVQSAPVSSAQTRLRSLRIRGMAVSGVNRVTGASLSEAHPVEIRVLLPGNYLRIDQDHLVERRAGFMGATLLNRWISKSADVQASASFGPGQLSVEQAHCARLLLGMLGDATGILPLSVERRSDTELSATKDGQPFAIIDLDRATGQPLRVRYQDRLRLPTPASPEERKTGSIPLPPEQQVEVTLFFENRRFVSGLDLPFLIRQVADSRTLETITLSEIQVNPPLKDSDFLR